jgi:hypothetical protein
MQQVGCQGANIPVWVLLGWPASGAVCRPAGTSNQCQGSAGWQRSSKGWQIAAGPAVAAALRPRMFPLSRPSAHQAASPWQPAPTEAPPTGLATRKIN